MCRVSIIIAMALASNHRRRITNNAFGAATLYAAYIDTVLRCHILLMMRNSRSNRATSKPELVLISFQTNLFWSVGLCTFLK